MSTPNPLERKLRREMAARKEAERLLELKSLELYEANQQLRTALKHLELKSEANLSKFEFEEHVDSMLIEFGATFLSTSLSDILMARFVEKLLGAEIIIAAAMRLEPVALASGKVPKLRQRRFGSESLARSITQHNQPHWQQNCLTLPIQLENEWLGGWAFEIDLSALEQEFVTNQMSLLVELVNSAISRQRSSEHQIELRKRAEESERSTREFVAMINHELRTPLNGVLGSAELLEKTALTTEQHDYLVNLRHGGELLRVIINDLLDYSKMNAGLLEIVPKAFAWQKLESALIGIFSSKAKSKQLELVVEHHGVMPAKLWADVERLKQVLVNLLGNAFKFTHQGRVTLQASWQEGLLTITVQDTGIGIPQDSINSLFDPFVQVDRTTTRHYEGSGLGLAICHNLMALMKGSITCESQPHVGSIFTLVLPAPEAKQYTVPANDASGVCQDKLALIKLLVVDDIRMNQIIVSQMLKKMGIGHDIRANGQEAIDAVANHQYDLIFMDCRMPTMDGYQATEQLRAKGFNAPIVALTAGTTAEERERCITCGMNDILAKPYTANDIEQMLGKWLAAKVSH